MDEFVFFHCFFFFCVRERVRGVAVGVIDVELSVVDVVVVVVVVVFVVHWLVLVWWVDVVGGVF